jgi:acyl-CoA reductase-like NAD-dependent aldehyde dehydrogenase
VDFQSGRSVIRLLVTKQNDESLEPTMAYTSIVNGQNGTEPASQIVVPLIIDGKEVIGPATFDVVSPYTNKTCWTATAASPKDAIRAVEAAQAAFPAWSKTKPTVRRDTLLKAADILESRLEANAEIMRTEMGADVGASQFFVVPLSIRMLRDIAGRITSICGSVPVVEEEGQSAIVYKEPMGVILGIVPWYVARKLPL